MHSVFAFLLTFEVKLWSKGASDYQILVIHRCYHQKCSCLLSWILFRSFKIWWVKMDDGCTIKFFLKKSVKTCRTNNKIYLKLAKSFFPAKKHVTFAKKRPRTQQLPMFWSVTKIFSRYQCNIIKIAKIFYKTAMKVDKSFKLLRHIGTNRQ